jgi:anti-sigma factor ChrR (cupin superfamily)
VAKDGHASLAAEERDRVALYVLGGMSAAEAANFEEHLASCRRCRSEVEGLKPLAQDLVLAGPESEPPPRLRQRVLERIRERFTLHTSGARRWLAADVPGVEISQLWVDAASGRHTLLLRLQAGATLPRHRHAAPEECYVVEGDLRDGALVLGAGDYVRHAPDTEHALTTRHGCLLFVTASLRDARVEASDPGGS